MKSLDPGPERVLGASERTVGLHAELSTTAPTPVRHRLAVGWPSDVVGVALGTANAIRPSLCDEPGLRQAFVLVAPEKASSNAWSTGMEYALSQTRAEAVRAGLRRKGECVHIKDAPLRYRDVGYSHRQDHLTSARLPRRGAMRRSPCLCYACKAIRSYSRGERLSLSLRMLPMSG